MVASACAEQWLESSFYEKAQNPGGSQPARQRFQDRGAQARVKQHGLMRGWLRRARASLQSRQSTLAESESAADSEQDSASPYQLSAPECDFRAAEAIESAMRGLLEQSDRMRETL